MIVLGLSYRCVNIVRLVCEDCQIGAGGDYPIGVYGYGRSRRGGDILLVMCVWRLFDIGMAFVISHAWYARRARGMHPAACIQGVASIRSLPKPGSSPVLYVYYPGVFGLAL